MGDGDRVVLKLKRDLLNMNASSSAIGSKLSLGTVENSSNFVVKIEGFCPRCNQLVEPKTGICASCRKGVVSSYSGSKVAELQPKYRPFDHLALHSKLDLDKFLQTGHFLKYVKAMLECIPPYVLKSCMLGMPLSEAARSAISVMTYSDLFSHLKTLRLDHIQKWMRPIIQKLMFHPRNANFFNKPVDAISLGIPDYYDVIKDPMDLGTIRSRMQRGLYESAAAVQADVDLVFRNAVTFNPASNAVHQAAVMLRSEFATECTALSEKCAREIERKATHSCSLCQGACCPLCGEICLKFESPVLVCHGTCGQRIKKNSVYHVTIDGILTWCQKCFSNLPATVMEFTSRPPLMKKDILKRKSDEEVAEPWVHCDCCGHWVHQVCSLYAGKVDDYQPERRRRDRQGSPKGGSGKRVVSTGLLTSDAGGYQCLLCKLEMTAIVSTACEQGGLVSKRHSSTEAEADNLLLSPRTSGRKKRAASLSFADYELTSPRMAAAKKRAASCSFSGSELAVSSPVHVGPPSLADTKEWTLCSQSIPEFKSADQNPVEETKSGQGLCLQVEQDSVELSESNVIAYNKDNEENGRIPKTFTVVVSESGASPVTSKGSVASFSPTPPCSPPHIEIDRLMETEKVDKKDDQIILKAQESVYAESEPEQITLVIGPNVDEPDDNASHHTVDDGTSTGTSVFDGDREFKDIDGSDDYIKIEDSHVKVEPEVMKVRFQSPDTNTGSTVSNARSSQTTKLNEISSQWRASDLPRSRLTDFLEQLVSERLRSSGYEDTPDSITIRLGSNAVNSTDVPEPLCANMKTREGVHIASSLPYKQKCILLFQNTDGVDICLFCLYVQEFGADCPPPNTSVVYIAYIDSIDYFRPMEARTLVYHEILVGYLAWAQARGFKQGHIWACPPQRGDNFIFWCHPQHQRTPSRSRLTAWYNTLLARAKRVGVLSSISNLWEEYFSKYGLRDKDESQQRSAAKNSFVTTSSVAALSRSNSIGSLGAISDQKDMIPHSPPVFEGDYWVTECLRLIRLVQQRLRGYDGLDKSLNSRRCRDLLKHLMTRHIATPFNTPVNPVALGIPLYFVVVKNPMDLGTVKEKLRIGSYATMWEFSKDIQLTFANAVLFNPPAHPIHVVAKQLDGDFKNSLLEMLSDLAGVSVDESTSEQWLKRFPLGESAPAGKSSITSRSASKAVAASATVGSAIQSITPTFILCLQGTTTVDSVATNFNASSYLTPVIEPTPTGAEQRMSSRLSTTSLISNDSADGRLESEFWSSETCGMIIDDVASELGDHSGGLTNSCEVGCDGDDGGNEEFPSHRLQRASSVDSLASVRRMESTDPEMSEVLEGRMWNSRSIYDTGSATGGAASVDTATAWDKPQLGFRGAMSMMTDLSKSVLRLKDDLFVIMFADYERIHREGSYPDLGALLPSQSVCAQDLNDPPKFRGRKKVAGIKRPEEVATIESFANSVEPQYLPECCLQMLDTLPRDTSDPDPILSSPLVDSRHTFLEMCQYRHYQFDTLRRAKYSSMMILHHLHNPSCHSLRPICDHCARPIREVRWHCDQCPDLDYCSDCFNSGANGRYAFSNIHEHLLTPFRVTFESAK